MKASSRLVLLAATAILLVACASQTSLDDTAASPDAPSGKAKPEPRSTCCINPSNSAEQREWNELVSKGSVYFDYEDYLVKDEFRPLLDAYARHLRSYGRRTVILAGNTDERGSSEYNLALGQKRADSVKRALMLLGVPEKQLEALSFGKEKPRAQGSDEVSWAKNRRVDFVGQ